MLLSQPVLFCKQSVITVVLMTSILLVSGCSHRNLIRSGQSYFAQQHFELAVAQFEQALAEKPNHQPTIEQLQQAKTALRQWASQLEIKADQANRASQQGKAMLLYAKVAQLTQSSHSIEQYNKIHQVLRQKSAQQAQLLQNNIGITKNELANIGGLRLVSNNQAAILLSFKQSIPIFEIQQSSFTKKTQYISGSQVITNPEFSKLQHRIRYHQDSHHNLRDELSDARHQLNQNTEQLSRLKNQQLNLHQRLLSTDLTAGKQQKLRKKMAQNKIKIVSVEQNVTNSREQADKYQHRLTHKNNQLSQLIDRLTYTPAVVSVPIYSDYHYPVQRQNNSLVAQLYLTVDNISTRAAQVSVSSQDDSHPAHPTIDLGPDPMIVKNQQQLTALFNTEIKQIAIRLLTELVDEKRHQFLRQANQTTDIDNKFSLWVNHGMVTPDGALPKIAHKIQQTLIMEYGVGGEFNVNQLLHRFK